MNKNEQLLQSLLQKGAGIYLRSLGHTVPLAAAHILNETTLWFCPPWPENEFAQHWVMFTCVAQLAESSMLDLYGPNGILGTIAELEPDEARTAQWERWKLLPADDAAKQFVSRLEDEALKGEL